MSRIYLSIGSNIDKEKNIRSCLKRLKEDFPDIVFSQLYETEAVGFDGDTFINLAARLETKLAPKEMDHYLKQIENEHARTRGGEKFTSRTLDFDLLLYDDLVLHPEMDIPRKEITKYAFVLFPLAEIAPDYIHPELKLTIRELSEGSTLDKTQLTAIHL